MSPGHRAQGDFGAPLCTGELHQRSHHVWTALQKPADAVSTDRRRSPVSASMRRSLTRGCSHRHRTRRRDHYPRLVVAVAEHQPVTRFVDLTPVGVDIGGDLGLQRSREHRPRPDTHDFKQLPARRAVLVGRHPRRGLACAWAYLPAPARHARLLIRRTLTFRIILRKVRLFTSPERGPSTSSDHCSPDRRGEHSDGLKNQCARSPRVH